MYQPCHFYVKILYLPVSYLKIPTWKLPPSSESPQAVLVKPTHHTDDCSHSPRQFHSLLSATVFSIPLIRMRLLQKSTVSQSCLQDCLDFAETTTSACQTSTSRSSPSSSKLSPETRKHTYNLVPSHQATR